ncbi:MAG: 50S ribosomal protein L5 [Deltaproteobacteria bacterium]|nr:50S ribosomal protein L5 [Deltaproteobacteria bacterium]
MATEEKKTEGKGPKPQGGGGEKKKSRREIAAKTSDKGPEKGIEPRLRTKYHKEVVPKLMEQFGYKNPMEVPRLVKVVINMGLGKISDAGTNLKVIENGVNELMAITGQRPVVTRSKKSIANFKLRAGVPVGVYVTLRANNMWEFVDRFISFALPRVRDFKGLPSKSFDGRGCYTVGVREHIIFPEIDFDNTDKVKGMNISIVTTAKTDEQARALLAALGVPFRV